MLRGVKIRGKDCPNSPIPNCRLIISKTNKIFLISKYSKIEQLIKQKLIKHPNLLT